MKPTRTTKLRSPKARHDWRYWPGVFVAAAIIGTVIGCKAVTDGSVGLFRSPLTGANSAASETITQRALAASETLSISNPPAKQIRFDGKEQLLGGGACQSMTVDALRTAVRGLVERQKRRSAVAFIQLHERSAQAWLLRDIDRHDGQTELVAATLDADKQNPVWRQHQAACRQRSEAAVAYQQARSRLVDATNTGQPVDSWGEQLYQHAEAVASIPLQIDASKLWAASLFARDRVDESLATLVQTAERANQSGMPRISSDLWLMACEASLHDEQVDQARSCWKAAVANQLTSIRMRSDAERVPAVDTVFWEHADRLIHPEDSYPAELKLAFSPWLAKLGIKVDEPIAAEGQRDASVALWSAIAQFQLATGQPHLATLSLKRAEQDAKEAVRPWLRIASARALAAQQQDVLATSLLSGLADHPNAAVAASALAVLGSIKIQSGAYQQGSEFLLQSLNKPTAKPWPGQLAAKADLANVRLIVASLDEALPMLHEIQNEMMIAGQWQSLCQSLENEAAILEIESLSDEAKAIRDRIANIERI